MRLVSKGFFLGRYDEDGGINTKWCGDLKQRLVFAPTTTETVDIAAPTLRFRAPARVKAGANVRLLLAAKDDGRAASVDVSLLKGAKALKRLNGVAVRPDGTVKAVSWRVPKTAKGTLRVCAAAFDPSGNASNRTCVRLTVT